MTSRQAPLPLLFKGCGFCEAVLSIPLLSDFEMRAMRNHVKAYHGLEPYEVER